MLGTFVTAFLGMLAGLGVDYLMEQLAHVFTPLQGGISGFHYDDILGIVILVIVAYLAKGKQRFQRICIVGACVIIAIDVYEFLHGVGGYPTPPWSGTLGEGTAGV